MNGGAEKRKRKEEEKRRADEDHRYRMEKSSDTEKLKWFMCSHHFKLISYSYIKLSDSMNLIFNVVILNP